MKKILWIIAGAILTLAIITAEYAHAANPVTFPINGGTGTSTKPVYGQVLLGNNQGLYDLVATSSLGFPSAAGTVTSVAASGGTTGLTFSGSPITTSGTLTLGGLLAQVNGGTGATSFGIPFYTFFHATTTDALTEGSTNLYFTGARAIASLLTGFSATTGTVTSSDSILTAIQKLAGNAATYLTNITGLVTAGTNVTITGAGTSGSPYVINASGGGGGASSDFTYATNYGIISAATTTPIWGQAGLFASSSSAYPTLAVGQSGAGPAALFTGGNVGVGTTSPYIKLGVTGGAYIGVDGLPAASIGTTLNSYTTDLNTNTVANSFQAVGPINAAGSAQTLNFALNDTGNNTSGTLIGVNGIAQKSGTGGATSLTGIQASPRLTSAATVTTLNGFMSQIRFNNASAVVTNAINFSATAPSTGGTVTSAYGFKTVAMKVAGVGTGYGFASDGTTDLNYFMGSTGVGTLNPGAKLTIVGTTTTTGVTFQTQNSSLTPLITALDNGNFGVGTSSPGSLFSLAGISNFTTATSTFYSTGGINLTGGGCFAVNGTCLSSGTTYTAGTGLTLTGGAFSVNTSQNIATLSNLTSNGLIKTSGGTGALSIATAGTDYQAPGNYITALTGDATASGPGSAALTLATVNSNVGTFNTLTVNAKGLVTAASNTSYQAPITLTTTGTSGAATFVSNTLNIPQYAGTTYTATYPVVLTGSVFSLAFGTSTSNTWGGTQTFTNSPVFSTLAAGTVNATGSGTLYSTATSTVSTSLGLSYSGVFGGEIGGASGTLSIATSSLYSGTTGQFPYFSGTNTITATSSLFLATSGNVGVGTTSPYALLGINAPAGNAPYFAIGSSTAEVFKIVPSASPLFGIGTTTPWRSLSVAGSVAITGNINASGLSAAAAGNITVCYNATSKELFYGSTNTTCTPSSERFKTDIATSSVGIDELMQLRPVTFYFKQGETQQQLGLIAEEVNVIDPRLVQTQPDGLLAGLRLDNIIGLLIKSVQDVANKNTQQDQEIADLKAQVQALQQERSAYSCRL